MSARRRWRRPGALEGTVGIAAAAGAVAAVGALVIALLFVMAALLRDEREAVCAATPQPIEVPGGASVFTIDVTSAMARAGRPREGRVPIEPGDVLVGAANQLVALEVGIPHFAPPVPDSAALGVVLRGHWRSPAGQLPDLYDQCGSPLPVVSGSVSPMESVITTIVDRQRLITRLTVVASPEVSQFAR